MFTNQVDDYVIDLDEPEDYRWAHVISAERTVARRLTREVLREEEAFAQLPSVLRKGVMSLARPLYSLSGGLYLKEMRAWGDAFGLSQGEVVALNCVYELVSKCTAGVVDSRRYGPVHVRTLDWPLEQIGPATRIFNFENGPHPYTVVGVLGHVGAFSGMVPGAYSVTINYAPPSGRSLRTGPSFLLRHALEHCATYDDVVEYLATAPLAASVFYVVCGTKKGQACCIERTRNNVRIRLKSAGPLVQANHYHADAFVHHNDAFDGLAFSEEREFSLRASLTAMQRSADLYDIASCLDYEPVLNHTTRQQVLFHPAEGDVHVWREA